MTGFRPSCWRAGDLSVRLQGTIIQPGRKIMKYCLALCALLFAFASSAQAQDAITLVAPGGARAAVEALIPAFEKQTGIPVKPTFGSGLGTKKQVANGDDFDVKIVQPPFPEVLASGNVFVKS